MSNTEERQRTSDQDTWSGKMSPERSVHTKGKISKPSLKKQSELSPRKSPIFLFLGKDGRWLDASATPRGGGAWHGEYLMHSFGERPSVVVESHLSQILEEQPHPKYSLSAKACQVIIRRAKHRGKSLPPLLLNALEERIKQEGTT